MDERLEVSVKQGWTEETELALLWEFLKRENLIDEAREFLEGIAAEENAS